MNLSTQIHPQHPVHVIYPFIVLKSRLSPNKTERTSEMTQESQSLSISVNPPLSDALRDKIQAACESARQNMMNNGLSDDQASEIINITTSAMLLIHRNPDSWPVEASGGVKGDRTEDQEELLNLLNTLERVGLEYGIPIDVIHQSIANMYKCRNCSNF